MPKGTNGSIFTQPHGGGSEDGGEMKRYEVPLRPSRRKHEHRPENDSWHPRWEGRQRLNPHVLKPPCAAAPWMARCLHEVRCLGELKGRASPEFPWTTNISATMHTRFLQSFWILSTFARNFRSKKHIWPYLNRKMHCKSEHTRDLQTSQPISKKQLLHTCSPPKRVKDTNRKSSLGDGAPRRARIKVLVTHFLVVVACMR